MTNPIPVVSFGKFRTGTKADQQDVAEQVYAAFSTVGFIYLKDCGISQSRVDEIFALAKTFFDQPLSKKLRYRLADPAVNQGYSADGAEGVDDHKESYEHRRFRNNLCPDEDALPGFRATLDAFYSDCYELAMDILRCLALFLGLGDDFFAAVTQHADPQMRLLHYPPIASSRLDREGAARIQPHTDFGLCTLLFQDGVGGLEVDPQHDGRFVPAPPIAGTVLVNIADLLQRYTNGRVRSTRHRVVRPASGTFEVLPARYSIPFFVHPDPETTIDPIVLRAGETKLYAPVNAGEWRILHTAKDYRLQVPEALGVTGFESLEMETETY